MASLKTGERNVREWEKKGKKNQRSIVPHRWGVPKLPIMYINVLGTEWNGATRANTQNGRKEKVPHKWET